MAQWMGAVGFHLEPLAAHVLARVREGEWIFAEETTLPTLSLSADLDPLLALELRWNLGLEDFLDPLQMRESAACREAPCAAWYPSSRPTASRTP
jgi:hypothetical protein